MELMKERTSPRLSMRGNVRVKVQNGIIRRIPAYLDDMSMGGFRMMMSEDVEIDQPIVFHMKTPYALRRISGVGRVRHVAEAKKPSFPKYSVGVEFSAVDKDKVKYILKEKVHSRYKRQQRRAIMGEMKVLLFLFPVLVIFASFASSLYIQSDRSVRESRAFEQEMKTGIVHFLFNSK